MPFYKATIRFLNRLKIDDAGIAISSELVMIATIVLVGLLVGMSAVRDAVTSELSDIGGAVQDTTTCYSINGLVGHSSSVAGMSYTDSTDHCDDPDDTPGVADNCITFDGPPANESEPVSTEELVLIYDFESGADDSSPFGEDNSGDIVGDPEFVDGEIIFDGDDAIFIPNSPDINIGIHEDRTIKMSFNADDVTTRQVLYEEGARTRGLVIYIENGLLYIGGWNIPTESGWMPTFISTPITAGTDIDVALVLNGGPTVQPDSLIGYLNGVEFGSAPGSQLWSHSGGIGLGGSNGFTLFHDGQSRDPNNFTGSMDDFCIFDRALSDDEIGSLSE